MLSAPSPLELVGVLTRQATRSIVPPAESPEVSPADAPDLRHLVVLFDRDCGVCQETVRTLRRWDHGRRLEFVPLQAAAGSGRPMLERVAADRALDEELHVVDEVSGEIAAGGQAALWILDVLPGGWLLRPWSILPSTTVAADLLYRLAARHRDTVGWLVGLRDEVACPAGAGLTGADRSGLPPIDPSVFAG